MARDRATIDEILSDLKTDPVVRGALIGSKVGEATAKAGRFWTPERLRAFRAEARYRANRATKPIKEK